MIWYDITGNIVDVSLMIHRKQVLTYLKLTGLPAGLLINFGEVPLKDGIHRLANANLEP